MRSTIESIRKKNPFTLYGTFLLLLLAVFVGCMTYCAHIVLSDEAPETGHAPWGSNPSEATETLHTIRAGAARTKGAK